MISYLKKLIPFSILIAVILLLLGMATVFKPAMPFAWVCFSVFFAISIMLFYFSKMTMQKRLGSFMGVYFTSIFAKLIIVAVVVLVFRSGNDASDYSYLVPFAIIYVSFLFFETTELVRLSRMTAAENKKKTESANSDQK